MQLNINIHFAFTTRGLDLVFVLDTSGGTGLIRFLQLMQTFTEQISMLLDISTQNSLAGMP